MRTIKIEAKYINLSDLKKKIDKMLKELDKNEKNNSISGGYLKVKSNTRGHLKAFYENHSVEDIRKELEQ